MAKVVLDNGDTFNGDLLGQDQDWIYLGVEGPAGCLRQKINLDYVRYISVIEGELGFDESYEDKERKKKQSDR